MFTKYQAELNSERTKSIKDYIYSMYEEFVANIFPDNLSPGITKRHL